jgi:hypothetical protein
MNYTKSNAGWQLDGCPETWKKIGILYSVDEVNGRKLCTVHKHGELGKTQELLAKHKGAYSQAGLGDMVQSLKVVDATNADPERVNHILSCSLQSEETLRNLDPKNRKTPKELPPIEL